MESARLQPTHPREHPVSSYRESWAWSGLGFLRDGLCFVVQHLGGEGREAFFCSFQKNNKTKALTPCSLLELLRGV